MPHFELKELLKLLLVKQAKGVTLLLVPLGASTELCFVQRVKSRINFALKRHN